MIAQGHTPCAPPTGSDWKARTRLPAGVVSTLARHRAQRLGEQMPEAWLWQGRHGTIVDGSPVSRPETEAKQAADPQPPGQPPG
jgi:hypothetical protein